MRFIRAPEHDFQVVAERAQAWSDYRDKNPGLGVWLIHLLDTGEFAGYCVLREIEWLAGNDLEIGYLVTSPHWGKGLATEIAKSLCQYAMEQFEARTLFAFIDPANVASKRVLEKCGFLPDIMVNSNSLRLKLDCESFQR